MKSSTIFLFIVLVSEVNEALGSASLVIQFIAFHNPSGRKYKGSCCDILCGECDHAFTICIDKDAGAHSVTSCKYYQHQTQAFPNTNYIDFTKYYDLNGMPNPFTTPIDKWPQKVTVKMEVWDSDSGWSADDKVDGFNFDLEKDEPFSSAATAHWTSVSHEYGQRLDSTKTILTYRWMLYCNDNYFGTDCSHYCMAQDDDIKGHYTCDPDTGDKICLPGWEDPDNSCRTIADNCLNVQCQNGGTCVDGYRQYSCACKVGYTGDHCETDIDECASNPCSHGGSCTDKVDGVECKCTNNRLGDKCQFHICEQGDHCQNGGSCVIDTDTTCLCQQGFFGTTCEHDFCAISPCQNDGTCTNGECTCKPGFFGGNCENNRCDFLACTNGGTCEIGVCKCVLGFSGLNCETNINDCLLNGGRNPCKNDGTCIDGVDEFTCRCLPNYDGDICQRSLEVTWRNQTVTPAPLTAPRTTPTSTTTKTTTSSTHESRNVNSQTDVQDNSLPVWIIVIIVVVLLLVLAIIIILLLVFKYRKKSREAKQNNMMNPAFMPQDIDSLTQARAAAQHQQAANQQAAQQAAAMQQAAAVQLAAAQLQAAYSQQAAQPQYGRQNSGPLYSRQNSTSSTTALLPQRGTRGSFDNTGMGMTAGGYTPAFDNHLNAKLNHLETGSMAGSTRTAGGGNHYDDLDKVTARKGKMPPPPPTVNLDIVAAAKASAIENN